MNALPDHHTPARHVWLSEMQGAAAVQLNPRKTQSDFEKSLAWRGVFIAALIIIVVNLPFSPAPMQAHLTARSTV